MCPGTSDRHHEVMKNSPSRLHGSMCLLCRGLGTLVAFVVLAAGLGVAPASAHDEFRFVGTVVRVETGRNRFSMKFREEDKTEVTVQIAFTPKTEVTRDKKNVARSELKAG